MYILYYAILYYDTRHCITSLLYYSPKLAPRPLLHLYYTCTTLVLCLYYTILYYTILYYTILYYTILYYTILYYTILYYTILYYNVLYST